MTLAQTEARNGFGPWLRRARSVPAIMAAIVLAVAVLAPADLAEITTTAAVAFAKATPFLAAAVLSIAALKATGAEGLVARSFVGRESQMIVVAALVGGLAPFCSCQVVPLVAALLAAGAPLSAIMAFWLASPLIDPPALMITAGALGWSYAIGKAVLAVFVGLFGGFAIKAAVGAGAFANPLRSDAPVSGCGCGASKSTGRPVWAFWREAARRQIFSEALVSNGLFLVKWLAFAYLLEALMIAYVPAEMVAGAVGGEGIVPIAIGALVGAPAYLNSYAAPPLVAALVEQGMSAGAAMAFMIAGAISCIPAMTAVFALVRRPVFAAYVGLGFAGAVASGVLFEMALPLVG